MIKIFTNVITGKSYDANGDLFEDGMPQVFYKSTERVFWQLCTETPDFAEGSNLTPEEAWTKCTDYAQYQAVGAFLTADSDYVKRLPGTLASGISAGTVTSISATIEGADFDTIPPTGVVELFASDGSSEIVKYASRTIEDGTVTFTAVSGSSVEKAYDSGSAMDCSQEALMQAALDTQNSDVANGLFAFRITAFSRKLHDLVAYSDVKSVDVMGLELALFRIDSDTNAVVDLERFEVDTFQIRTGMAETSANPPVTDPEANEIVTLCNTLLAAGFLLQFSADGSNWHDTQVTTGETIDVFFRFRSTGSGGTWSNGVRLVKGDKGDDGASAFCYVAFASDDEGSDFSLGEPAASSQYVAFLATDTEIETPSATDFAGLWTLYKGPQGNPGAAGQRGTVTYFGTKVTGTSAPAAVFDTDIESAMVGDSYVNTSTLNYYECTLGGADTVAKWKYVGSLKGPQGDARYLYVAYASNSSGADFSLTPSTNLKYVAIKNSDTEIQSPSASDFTGLWQQYIGDPGASAYVYVAYASSSSGSGFSMTPSDSLKYRAEIHTTTPISNPSSSDFSGATWVKYLGDNGTNGTRGSRTNYGTAITGTSTTPTSYATDISDSLVGDQYINSDTMNLYRCTMAGNASTAKWIYVGAMKGEAETALEGVKLNGEALPIESKAVDVTALAVAYSMPSAETCKQNHLLYLGTTVSGDSYVGKLRTYQQNSYDNGEKPYLDLTIVDATATGTSRVWTGYNEMDHTIRIRYDNGAWILERKYLGPDEPYSQIGTLTAAAVTGQPWGGYTVSSGTWTFFPLTECNPATKFHLYERNETWNSDILIVKFGSSDPQTLFRVGSSNVWNTNGTPGGDDVQISWGGTDTGPWIFYNGFSYYSPSCPSTTMPWEMSGVWTEPYDDFDVNIEISRQFTGGWVDQGPIVAAS